jgi:Arc/MetJ-type ribon-helix-helix transcriptional regulator
MVRKQKAVTHGLRYNAELNNRIEAGAKQGGFSSRSAFMRAAIERELAGRESGVDVAEQRIAASLDRMARENRNLRLVRPVSVVRFRRYAGEDALDLCARTTEGCARPSRRPR